MPSPHTTRSPSRNPFRVPNPLTFAVAVATAGLAVIAAAISVAGPANIAASASAVLTRAPAPLAALAPAGQAATFFTGNPGTVSGTPNPRIIAVKGGAALGDEARSTSAEGAAHRSASGPRPSDTGALGSGGSPASGGSHAKGSGSHAGSHRWSPGHQRTGKPADHRGAGGEHGDASPGKQGKGGSSHARQRHHRRSPCRSSKLHWWICHAELVLRQHGAPSSAIDTRAAYIVVERESGGDPHAYNGWDSNAAAGTPSKGIAQVIGPTFDTYALPHHHNIWNPVDNMIAAFRYAISRYGSMKNIPGVVAVRKGGYYVGY